MVGTPLNTSPRPKTSGLHVSDPRAQAIFTKIHERAKAELGVDLNITSQDRDPEHNAAAGGAKNSQHTHGKAIDLRVAGLSEEKKAALLNIAAEEGVKGFGIYRSGYLSGEIIHLDCRPNFMVWGPDPDNPHKRVSIDQTPEWARAALEKAQNNAGRGAPAATQTAGSGATGRRTPAAARKKPPGVGVDDDASGEDREDDTPAASGGMEQAGLAMVLVLMFAALAQKMRDAAPAAAPEAPPPVVTAVGNLPYREASAEVFGAPAPRFGASASARTAGPQISFPG